MAERKKPRLTRIAEVEQDGTRRPKVVRLEEVANAPPVPGRRELGEGEKTKARELWNRAGRFLLAGRMNVEQWVDGFTADLHPETELLTWEMYADVTDELWADGVGDSRESLLATVVRVSTGEVDVPANAPGVTDAMVQRIRAACDARPVPRKPLTGLPEAVTRVGCPVYPLAALAQGMTGDWQSRDDPLVRAVRDDADVIMGVSRDGKGEIYYGRETWERIATTGITKPVARIAFLIDGTGVSDDMEVLGRYGSARRDRLSPEGASRDRD